MTRPPDQFTYKELHWPMPVLRFMLPCEFSQALFGCQVLSLIVSTAKNQEIYNLNCNIGTRGKAESSRILLPDADEIFLMGFSTDESTTCNSLYYFKSGTSKPVNTTTDWQIASKADPFHVQLDESPEQKANNTSMAEKLRILAVNLLCYMSLHTATAATTLIRPGSSGKKPKAALWSPRIVGQNYNIRTQGAPAGGSHSSPRTHWRCGHWRNQPWGKQNLQRRLIWLEPTMVQVSI